MVLKARGSGSSFGSRNTEIERRKCCRLRCRKESRTVRHEPTSTAVRRDRDEACSPVRPGYEDQAQLRRDSRLADKDRAPPLHRVQSDQSFEEEPSRTALESRDSPWWEAKRTG